MSQTSLDDDLFGEAADDLRSDIESSLDDARAALPDPEEVWNAEADNVVGVLNGLRAAMDPGDAEEHLRDAKKWYTMGERAEAFDDAADLAAEIESVEAVVEEITEAREGISDLAGTVPQLRSTLEEAHSGGDGAAAEDGDDAAAADGENTDAAADGGEPQEE
jgi:hypothetical protein